VASIGLLEGAAFVWAEQARLAVSSSSRSNMSLLTYTGVGSQAG
jgi:hypothetical protein